MFDSFKKGDQRAFHFFFEKYYGQLHGFSSEFIHSAEDAKSIVQESFVNLWLKRAEIESPAGIKSYLYTFAKSKCLNHLRHQKVREKYKNHKLNQQEQQLNIDVLNALKFDTASLSEMERKVHQSIEELPEQTRAIFVKKRFNGKGNEEIANELNVSVKTVEAHTTKALRLLRTSLSEYLPAYLIAFYLYF